MIIDYDPKRPDHETSNNLSLRVREVFYLN